MAESFYVVVIGGGTAGLVTASGCARLGRKVALIDREALGGDCLWTGCVPTKSLVASARLIHQMQHADVYGLEAHQPVVTPRAIMESMRGRRKDISRHDAPEKFQKLGIDVIKGEATLASPRQVSVNGRQLLAKDVVIATGTRTAVPPIEGLHENGFLDHRSFLDRDTFPKSILMMGGGAIGVEFAQMLRRFGSEVTIVEMADDILIKEDRDVIAGVRTLLSEEGVSTYVKWSVKSVRTDDGMKIVRIESKSGETKEIRVEEIFVASGRRGNTEGLELERAGIKVERSYVVTDKYLQTSVPRVWACGDINGGLQFTHVAAFEAVKLVRNMLFPGKSAVDYTNIPWAIYTDPEVAHIGLTESEAADQHGAEKIKTYRVEMADVDRAVVDRTDRGFIKFVCDQKGRILGAHAFCANASTVIEEVVLARKKGMKVGDLAQLISPYPSLADAIQKTASLYYQDLGSSWLGAVGKRVAGWSQ